MHLIFRVRVGSMDSEEEERGTLKKKKVMKRMRKHNKRR